MAMRETTIAGPARTFLRLAWYRTTKRMPRYDGKPEPERRLSDDELAEFGGLLITWREGAGADHVSELSDGETT